MFVVTAVDSNLTCDNSVKWTRHWRSIDNIGVEIGVMNLVHIGFHEDELKRPAIHIKLDVTVALMESIEASAMLACRPVTNDW